jgi:hypothetical protein
MIAKWASRSNMRVRSSIFLSIYIAQRPRCGRKKLIAFKMILARWSCNVQLLLICRFASRTVGYQPMGAAFVHTRPRLDLLLLIHDPHPPVSIELAVVQPEGWFSRAYVHITARVAPYAEMTSNVKHSKVVGIAGLERILEGTDGFVAGDVG